jgi:hypothetical protein
MNATEARIVGRLLEASGYYWCRDFELGPGVALVEVRSRARPYRLLRTLRTPEEAQAFLTDLGDGLILVAPVPSTAPPAA